MSTPILRHKSPRNCKHMAVIVLLELSNARPVLSLLFSAKFTVWGGVRSITLSREILHVAVVLWLNYGSAFVTGNLTRSHSDINCADYEIGACCNVLDLTALVYVD